jgi:hypothetical protein
VDISDVGEEVDTEVNAEKAKICPYLGNRMQKEITI